MKLMFLFLISFALQAQLFVSAKRLPFEDYRDIMAKYEKTYAPDSKGYSSSTPNRLAKYYSQYNLPQLPQWKNFRDMENAFYYVRDLRFLDWTYQGEDFPRRSTWLYPDDGCFARAELIITNLEDKKNRDPIPYKVFVFGNLEVETINSPDGYVSWWYHVVPITAYNNEYYVFDPAIDAERPLTLEEWLGTMGSNINKLKIAVCNAHTVFPDDDCYSPDIHSKSTILYYQNYFLSSEWQRVKILGRNPIDELGNNPPWR